MCVLFLRKLKWFWWNKISSSSNSIIYLNQILTPLLGFPIFETFIVVAGIITNIFYRRIKTVRHVKHCIQSNLGNSSCVNGSAQSRQREGWGAHPCAQGIMLPSTFLDKLFFFSLLSVEICRNFIWLLPKSLGWEIRWRSVRHDTVSQIVW